MLCICAYFEPKHLPITCGMKTRKEHTAGCAYDTLLALNLSPFYLFLSFLSFLIFIYLFLSFLSFVIFFFSYGHPHFFTVLAQLSFLSLF